MRFSIDWVKRLMSRGSDRPASMMQIFTPQVIGPRHPGLRFALAGVTLGGLALFSAVALGALCTLFLALGAIYFLVTQVLGIQLDVDPRAFVAQAQRYAQYAQN